MNSLPPTSLLSEPVLINVVRAVGTAEPAREPHLSVVTWLLTTDPAVLIGRAVRDGLGDIIWHKILWLFKEQLPRRGGGKVAELSEGGGFAWAGREADG